MSNNTKFGAATGTAPIATAAIASAAARIDFRGAAIVDSPAHWARMTVTGLQPNTVFGKGHPPRGVTLC